MPYAGQQHVSLFVSSVAELGPAHHNGLIGFVGEVQRLHNGTVIQIGFGPQAVIKGVF